MINPAVPQHLILGAYNWLPNKKLTVYRERLMLLQLPNWRRSFKRQRMQQKRRK